MNIIKYVVEIKGVRDYLMHKFSEGDPNRKRGSHPTAEEDCEDALYRSENGIIFVPSRQLEASIVKASADFKFTGKRTMKDIILSGVIVEPEEIPMEPQEYVQYSVPVRIQQARIIKSRPRFKNWSLTFTIVNSDPERILDAKLKDIIIAAGETRGIGDWRPKFGTFEVIKFERLIKE
ncbi:MAG: hypothetical protein ACYDAP_00175 [Thermoplasmataceae archaeon]